MARRLKTIAKWINDNLGHLGYSAGVRKGIHHFSVGSYCGGNVVGYHGQREGTVFTCSIDGVLVKQHNAAEAYRRNSDVERWLERELRKLEVNA